jgi:hypothetical protein
MHLQAGFLQERICLRESFGCWKNMHGRISSSFEFRMRENVSERLTSDLECSVKY